jgi:hypothetical protein
MSLPPTPHVIAWEWVGRKFIKTCHAKKNWIDGAFVSSNNLEKSTNPSNNDHVDWCDWRPMSASGRKLSFVPLTTAPNLPSPVERLSC